MAQAGLEEVDKTPVSVIVGSFFAVAVALLLARSKVQLDVKQSHRQVGGIFSFAVESFSVRTFVRTVWCMRILQASRRRRLKAEAVDGAMRQETEPGGGEAPASTPRGESMLYWRGLAAVYQTSKQFPATPSAVESKSCLGASSASRALREQAAFSLTISPHPQLRGQIPLERTRSEY